MLEVDGMDPSITLMQLLHEVEQGHEVMILQQGQPIARLSPLQPLRRPLASHQALRALQSQPMMSSLDTLDQLRQEARY